MPEFWCALDWLAEKNLDAEERMDEAKAGRQPAQSGRPVSFKGGEARLATEARPRVTFDADLNLEPRPGWYAWREQLRLEHGV